jgi:glyoxylase-like metal-dependent hydrolase (beta-lactamase superfamily II)
MGRAQRRPGCGAYPRQGVADLHGEPNTRDVDAKRQLGEFLQTRRSQLTPEDVGLTTYGDRRRVTGLRREELALLAGVSPSYYSGQVVLWDAEHTIDANLTLRAAPGHTPGASAVVLESGADRALFAGDLLHSPLQVLHPGHSSCFCEDAATAETSRQRLLGWAADHRALVLPAHFSGHGGLEVERRGAGFGITQWAPFDRY